MWVEDAVHTVFMSVASVIGGVASVVKYVRSPGTFDPGDGITGLSYLLITFMLVLDMRSKLRQMMERRRDRKVRAVKEVLGS